MAQKVKCTKWTNFPETKPELTKCIGAAQTIETPGVSEKTIKSAGLTLASPKRWAKCPEDEVHCDKKKGEDDKQDAWRPPSTTAKLHDDESETG